MSKLAPVPKTPALHFAYPNNITFPKILRDAIPEHEPSAGRCLNLDSVDAQASHTDRWGRRVQLNLHVCETGKLSGAFDIWCDLELEAARTLAQTVLKAVEQAERLPQVKAW